MGAGAGASSHATWDDIIQLFKAGGRLAGVRSAIVYCAYKDDADKLAQRLNAHGIRAAPYHAGRHLRVRLCVTCLGRGGWGGAVLERSPPRREAPAGKSFCYATGLGILVWAVPCHAGRHLRVSALSSISGSVLGWAVLSCAVLGLRLQVQPQSLLIHALLGLHHMRQPPIHGRRRTVPL